MMNYEEALTFLHDLTKFGYNFGLGRITQLLKMLGDPHHQLKVIHIGGTNGKGSTAAMTAEILFAAGYKTALFSSPHIHNYTERMSINGREIPRERFAYLIDSFRPLLDKMVAAGHEHPTEFEVNTALALKYFADEKVDFVVLEVGLGGVIDSTNVVDSLVSVITNVSMDHMDYLGDTLESIAQIKAGIIKPNSKVVTAAEEPTSIKIIREMAMEKNAELLELGQAFNFKILNSDLKGVSFDYLGKNKNYQNLKTTLLGEHQAKNGATAVAIIEALTQLGYQIEERAIRDGLKRVNWLGRLEILQDNPKVLIDAAHNVDGALTLTKALKDLFTYEKLVLIMGMLADKEREKVLSIIAPLADKIIVTKPNSPRAEGWEKIGEFAKDYISNPKIIPSVEEAVLKGLELTGERDLLCITGSIYMIAEAREILLRK